ncbi:MAG: PAS domain S-box protein, partial [Pseudohongiella sp.]|nr:PAS domain S-box protein [Pseudohongiella sp.]
MTIAHVLIVSLAALSLLLFIFLLLRQRGWRIYSPRDKQINAHLNTQSMRILSSVVEQSRSGVIIADRHGVIEYVNPRYTQITGYSSAEATGRVAELIENEAL